MICDDGAECSTFAILPSLLQYGELNYGEADEKTMELRCRDCFGISYADFLKLDQVGLPTTIDPDRSRPPCYEKMALYNDVLLGVLDADLKDAKLPEKFARDAAVLRAVPENRYSMLFETQLCYAEALAVKSDLSIRIKTAYRAGDKAALAAIVEEDFPQVRALLEEFHDAFRAQWYAFNKAFGFEVQDIRMGGIKERLNTASLRLTQYISGELAQLEELEQEELPFNHRVSTDVLNSWRRATSASVMAW